MFKNILIGLLLAALLVLLSIYGYDLQTKPASLIPDLKGQEFRVACWVDSEIVCREADDGTLNGVMVDYYNEACVILNCVPKFIRMDSTNMRTMMAQGQIDTSFLGQISRKALGLDEGKLVVVTMNYGVMMRADDMRAQTIEDVIGRKDIIVAMRTDWPLPDIQELFKNNQQLNDWPFRTEDEILLRGATDVLFRAGVLRGDQITYATVLDGERLLDGNPLDYLAFTPVFVEDKGYGAIFDIATAILVENGTMDRVNSRFFDGPTATFRERALGQ